MLGSTQQFGPVPCTAHGAIQQRTSSEPLALPVMHIPFVQHLGGAYGALLLGEPSSVCFRTLLVNEAPSAVWKAVPMTQRDVR